MKALASWLVMLGIPLATAQAGEESPPRWDAGAGFGYLRFEHYPASDQSTELWLPVPTFSYRGRILRADDRDGAKLFLFKSPGWTLQFGGLAFPPLTSSTNSARQGLSDLPLLAALGPQLVRPVTEELTFKMGAYQALAATWLAARPSGILWELDATYRKSFDWHDHPTVLGIDEVAYSLSANLMGASREVHSVYYDVAAQDGTPDRPAFTASAGLLQSQLSFFQTLRRGDFSFYFGARLSDYRLSPNRASPLYRADQNFAVLAGFTITLFKSQTPAVPSDDTSGVINRLRERSSAP